MTGRDGPGVTTETHGPVLVVRMARPERRNALDSATSHAMGRVFDDFEADPDLRVAILTGTGDQAFCAGADLKQTEPPGPEGPVPPSGFGGLTDRFGRRKPVVAAVNGVAVGGGFELALASDLVVAVDGATFALPEPRVGLVAGSGGLQRLVREVGPTRAAGIALTGRRVPAAEAMAMGLVNEVVPGDVVGAARRWADLVLAGSPVAIRATKAVLDDADGRRVEDALRRQPSLPAMEGLYEGDEATEGRRAFAEGRVPSWVPRNDDEGGAHG